MVSYKIIEDERSVSIYALCWHSSLLGKCVLIHMTAHNTLIINSIKNLITQKALIGTEPFRGEEALLENIKIYSKSGYS